VFSYSTVLIKLTRDPVTGNLNSAPNSQVQAFSYGVGEDAAPAGFPAGSPVATEDLTDSFNGGPPVERGQMAVVTGMTCNVMRPLSFETILGGTALRSYDTNWMAEYDMESREAVMMGVLIEYTYGNTACKYRMGVPGDWAQMAGSQGPVIANGNPTAGVYLPFRAATVINARDESRKLTINVRTGSLGISIRQGSGTPTVTDLYLPIRFQLLRYPICAVDAGACATGGLSDADADKIAQRILARQK